MPSHSHSATKPPVSTAAPRSRETAWHLVLVVLLTLVARGGVLLVSPGELALDPDGYRAIARELRTAGQFARRDNAGPPFATAFRPPLYPLALAAISRGDHLPWLYIGLLHLAWGVVTAVLTYLVGRHVLRPRLALVAALLTTFDPLLLNQSRLVMTETLAALLTIGAAAALVAWGKKPSWQRACTVGAVLGCGILCRPTYLVALGLLLLTGLALHDRLKLPGRRRHWLAMLAAAGVVVAPWLLRNLSVFQRPIATTTHGGYTLLLGNNPFFYDFVESSRWDAAWDAEPFHAEWQRRRSQLTDRAGELTYPVSSPAEELAEDAAAYAWATQTMRERPGGFLLASLYRVWQFVSPLPNRVETTESYRQQAARFAVAGWHLAVYALIVAGLPWRSARGDAFALFATTLLLAFLGVHTFYWTNLRMRAPLVPLMSIAAAIGVERLLTRRGDATGELPPAAAANRSISNL